MNRQDALKFLIEKTRWMWEIGSIATLRNPDEERPPMDFVQDADRFMVQQDPIRARLLLRLSALSVLLLLIWSALTDVDEITRGEGKVVPSQQLQVLQSLDGGIVSAIQVREGQVVEEGAPLLQIDSTRFQSSVSENRAQYIALVAKAERLKALTEGRPFHTPPEATAEDAVLIEQERRYFETASYELQAQVSIARQQMVQREQELTEARAKREQAIQGHDLSAKELAMTRPLINSGAVSEVELLRLERDVSRYSGERDMASAQISRAQAGIAEARRKIDEVELTFRNELRKELSETMGKLNALSAGSVGLADKVKHSTIRAPLKGVVKRIMANTVGGVVQPGKDVIELVPTDDALLLETKVLPKDIAFIRPKQPALVKFTAYDYSIYGGLDAKVESIGADSITDDKGNTYFLVKVRTLRPRLGAGLPIIPGMMAEVDIVTGEKSILTYLLKPVLRAKQVALSER